MNCPEVIASSCPSSYVVTPSAFKQAYHLAKKAEADSPMHRRKRPTRRL